MNATVPYAEINDLGVRRFLSAWDPNWRWVMLLGLREMRANADRLGQMAAEQYEDESWSASSYTQGPLAMGVTAAAVNEACLHCEDLFALLRILKSPEFVRDMSRYKAGKVTNFGAGLSNATNTQLRRLYLFPEDEIVRRGFEKAEDPDSSFDALDEHFERLGAMTRRVVAWYDQYSYFHIQYKHGLKIALRPYGTLTDDAVRERTGSVRAPLIAFTNEDVSEMVTRPQNQQGMIFPDLSPLTQPYLSQLVAERRLLRYRQSGREVDLDEVVEVSETVSRLLRVLIQNRVALMDGLNEHGQQEFQLPGPDRRKVGMVSLELVAPVTISSFR